MSLNKKRSRDTSASENILALVGITAVIATLGVFVPKAEASVEPPQEEYCMPFYEAGAMFMRLRQDGTTLPEMLDMYKDAPAVFPMIKNTFRVSKFDTPKYQQEAVNEFAESQYNRCEREAAGLSR